MPKFLTIGQGTTFKDRKSEGGGGVNLILPLSRLPGLNFCYLAIKLPNFKSVDEKLPEFEPRVSHSFVIKIVSRKER